MSQWNYFVTAQPATAVTHAVCPLAFTSPTLADLVVARGTHVEVLRLGPEGGSPTSVCKSPVNGRVCGLQPLRPPGASRDLLLLLTEKRQLTVLRFAPAEGEGGAGQLVTVAMASLREAIGRQPVDHQPFFACDPGGRAAAAYMYEGLLQVVALGAVPAIARGDSAAAAEAGLAGPIDLNAGGHIFPTQDPRPQIKDLVFLHPGSAAAACPEQAGRPLLATLHADRQDLRTLRTWSADLAAHSIALTGSAAAKAAASRLAAVPPPHGGLLVLGGSSASYYDETARRVTGAAGGPREVAAVAARTDSGGVKWLIADADGHLWLLRLRRVGSSGSSSSSSAAPETLTLSFEQLGLASPPSALAWLADNRAFVGSALGDSQFLCFSAAGMNGDHFVVEDAWMNLGPIVDFCTADIDDQGQSQVVTCSGSGQTGSLHLLRIGVGVNEVGALEGFSGVLGLWALPGVGGGALVLSFAGCTRVLALCLGGTELEERPAPGFSCDEETLLCCEAEGLALQATRTGLRAASLDGLAAIVRWTPPKGSRLQVAAAAPGGAVVALGGGEGEVVLLRASGEMGGGHVEVAGTWRLGAEVSCLHARAELCAVGLWTRELRVLPLRPGAEPSAPWPLPGTAVPRSAAFARLAGRLRLLVGLGDGVLATWEVDEATGALSQRHAVYLGSEPVQLLPFGSRAGGEEHVFATGDRPMILHGSTSAAGQLAYAAVNLRHVSHIAPFDVAPFAGCLAFVAEKRLMVGSFDEIQRVHVRRVPLGDCPHRIAYHKGAGVFAVACQASGLEDTSADSRCSGGGGAPGLASVRFVGARSLETVQSLQLEPRELVSSLCSAVLEGDDTEYIAVGAALVDKEEPEPMKGRLLLYAPQRSAEGDSPAAFALAAELEVSGAVFSLLPFRGMLLGSVNNRVVVWQRCADEPRRLQEVCCHGASMLALHLQARGNSVLVGDLMRSASLLQFNPQGPSLEEVARDTGSAWLTAVEMLGEELFLCADESHNLFTLARGAGASKPQSPSPARPCAGSRSRCLPLPEDPCSKLERVGQMYSGEFVNRLRQAALAQSVAAAGGGEAGNLAPVEQVVWASTDGAIGLIASLNSEEEFVRLSLIQDAISREAPGIAGLPHGDWRNVAVELGEAQPHRGFVDGDLLESLLEMPRHRQQVVADRLLARGFAVDGVEGLLREVEQLARLH